MFLRSGKIYISDDELSDMDMSNINISAILRDISKHIKFLHRKIKSIEIAFGVYAKDSDDIYASEISILNTIVICYDGPVLDFIVQDIRRIGDVYYNTIETIKRFIGNSEFYDLNRMLNTHVR